MGGRCGWLVTTRWTSCGWCDQANEREIQSSLRGRFPGSLPLIIIYCDGSHSWRSTRLRNFYSAMTSNLFRPIPIMYLASVPRSLPLQRTLLLPLPNFNTYSPREVDWARSGLCLRYSNLTRSLSLWKLWTHFCKWTGANFQINFDAADIRDPILRAAVEKRNLSQVVFRKGRTRFKMTRRYWTIW